MMRRKLFGLILATMLASCGKGPDVEHGKRIATVMGCTSCHGDKLDGHLFEENPEFVIAWSSNLSRILPGWSDAQIEAVLRTGKRPDGSPLWFMPTFAQKSLSPADMRDLIAWLRSVPPTGELHPAIKPGPGMKQALANGFQDSAAQAVRLAPRSPVALGAGTERGRYFATIACAECHGPDLKGVRDPAPGDPPDLSIAAAYSPKAFRHLLRTGTAQSGKPAGAMAEEARKRLSSLTDDEIDAIYAYLVARSKR